MNDRMLNALMVTVERAVRPLRATMARKRKMREELLAHLTATFEEELARTGSEQAALDQTRLRFGDSRLVSRELQDSVSWRERLSAMGDYYWLRRPGESLFRLASRQILMMGGPYVVSVLVMPVLQATRGRTAETGVVVFSLAVVGCAMTALSLLSAVISDALARSIHGTENQRSWRLAAICGLASLCIFPAMGFLPHWVCSGEVLTSLWYFKLGCCFAPVAPIVLWLLARHLAYEREWARLPIDE